MWARRLGRGGDLTTQGGSMKKTILVSGSRNFPNKILVQDTIRRFVRRGDLLVHGGARGVDTWAAAEATSRGAATRCFYPNWDKYGASAGIRRNREMLDDVVYMDPDCIILIFWDGKSSGTKHMLEMCTEADCPFLLWTQ